MATILQHRLELIKAPGMYCCSQCKKPPGESNRLVRVDRHAVHPKCLIRYLTRLEQEYAEGAASTAKGHG